MSPGDLEKIKAGLAEAYETATRNRKAQIAQIKREGKVQGDAVTRARGQLRLAQMRNTLRSYGLGDRDVGRLLKIPNKNGQLAKAILDATETRSARIAEMARLQHALDSLKREVQ